MLNGDRIKPYLLHEEQHMRAAAAHYFYEAWSQDTDLVPSVLTGCKRFGFADNVSALSCCWRFPLTKSCVKFNLPSLASGISHRQMPSW